MLKNGEVGADKVGGGANISSICLGIVHRGAVSRWYSITTSQRACLSDIASFSCSDWRPTSPTTQTRYWIMAVGPTTYNNKNYRTHGVVVVTKIVTVRNYTAPLLQFTSSAEIITIFTVKASASVRFILSVTPLDPYCYFLFFLEFRNLILVCPTYTSNPATPPSLDVNLFSLLVAKLMLLSLMQII